MSNGIFVNTDTNINTKCVVFGTIMTILYYVTACNPSIFMIPVIYTISYIAMGWYDEIYSCSKPLFSGSHSWGMAITDSIFKPQRESGQTRVNEPPVGKYLVKDQETVYRRYMYLFHMLIVGPLLIYIGYDRGRGFSANLFLPMLWLAILGMTYHCLRIIKPRPQQNRIVYVQHALFVMPLLMYIGHFKEQTPKIAFNVLLILGVFAELYHTTRYFLSR